MNNEWESRVRAEWDCWDNGRFGHLEGTIQIIEELLASERADWLRSEIEKLEGEIKDRPLLREDQLKRVYDMSAIYNEALTSIITRYKEELLELDRKEV